MIKLYKKIGSVLNYFETWEEDETSAIFHYGTAGTTGATETIKEVSSSNLEKKINDKISKMKQEGYNEIDNEDHSTLIVKYKIKNMGTEKDLQKRHRLQNRMQETLGWTGLGFCDGGSIGSSTMEVCCLVVDFTLAKKVIIDDLKETEFSDYTKIYDEEAS